MQYAEIELSGKAMQRMWCRRSVEFIWVERAHESRTFQARHVPNCMCCGTSANPSKHSRWRGHRVSVVCTYHRSVEKMADNRVFCLFLSDRQAQAPSTDIKWMHSESARVSWRSCSVCGGVSVPGGHHHPKHVRFVSIRCCASFAVELS